MPIAHKEIPYKLANEKDINIESATQNTGTNVERYPRARPLIRLGAGPFLHDSARI